MSPEMKSEMKSEMESTLATAVSGERLLWDKLKSIQKEMEPMQKRLDEVNKEWCQAFHESQMLKIMVDKL